MRIATHNANMVIARRLEALAPHVLKLLAQKWYRRLGSATYKHPIVDVFLVSPRKMREIKQEFLIAKQGVKKLPPRKIVDVLAFPEPNNFPHPDRGENFLGEVYINAEIFDENPERGASLFVHGFLHLLGYGHTKKRDRIMMEKAEKKLLKKLKFKNI